MAEYANKPYCINPAQLAINQPGIMGDIEVISKDNFEIIGPPISREKMMKTRFQLSRIGIFKLKHATWEVDSYWWKFLTSEICENFFSKIDGLIKSKRTSLQLIDINLTGHGVGGVYTQILGLLLNDHLATTLYDKNYRIRIYSFGSPRVGNFQFAQNVNRRYSNLGVYRLTYYDDFAPHFPRVSILGTKYVHAETEFWINPTDCDCLFAEGYEIYKCPGFFSKDQDKYGENLRCNLGTNGTSEEAHFGPYFGTIFGYCGAFGPSSS
ncbi:hypothetical protein G9A89_001550 [Geosiphon pyriformis]|nr:hypothetical protein G9A89_001550 [Geosiphon pyriformis]